MLRCAYMLASIHMQNILRAFKALSNETRLRIMNLLLERECSVCEVVQAMTVSQTRASRGLATLHDAGLLKARREGLWVFYSMDEEGVGKSYGCLTQLIRSALEGNKLATLDRERLKMAVRESPCIEVFRSLSARNGPILSNNE